MRGARDGIIEGSSLALALLLVRQSGLLHLLNALLLSLFFDVVSVELVPGSLSLPRFRRRADVRL